MRPPPAPLLAPDGTALWDWPCAGRGAPRATVALVHATGFHSRCWDEVVRHLPETFRCVCLDMPGHGHSSAPNDPPTWRSASRRLLDALADVGVPIAELSVLAGHSMGGHLSVLMAAASNEPVPALLLVDPVILPPEWYEAAERSSEQVQRSTLQRKAFFSSADEMFNRFNGRMPYAAWEKAVLRDYCNFGLGEPGPEGVRPLLCSPAVEAACYAHGHSRDSDPTAELGILAARRQRATVLRAGQDPQRRPFLSSPTDPALAARLGQGAEDVLLAEVDHFIPMTHPALVAQHIERLVGTQAKL